MRKYKIRNTFIYLNFKRWLKNNIHRFKVRAYIEKVDRTSFRLVFSSVDNIKIVFDKNGGVNVWAIKNKHEKTKLGRYSNLLTDFDTYEARDSNGYFCSFSETPIYYSDRNSIWEALVYELLLEWANEKLVPENYLCIYEYDGGCASNILTSSQVEDNVMLKQRVYCKPVINQEKG